MMRTLASDPLHTTAARVDATISWGQVRVGLPKDTADWTRCSDVDAERALRYAEIE